MKVYTCTKFKGHWPVGTSAVVVAPSKFMAAMVLETELAKRGLRQNISSDMLEEVDMVESKAVILSDGDY